MSRWPLLSSKKAMVPEGVFDAFAQLAALADAKRNAREGGRFTAAFWLGQHNARAVDDARLVAAQSVLDRAVEGGFFDAYEGRPAVGESEVAVRREMLDEAAALLEDASVEVHACEEDYCDPEGRKMWRTRLVACPKKP